MKWPVRIVVFLLVLTAGFAHAQDHGFGEETGRRKTRQSPDAKAYLERYARPERLPKEFRESWLFKHEVPDARRSEERGITLRDHVAEKDTPEAIRE